MDFLLELLFRTCIETIYFTGAIILIGLVLGVLRNATLKNFQISFGRRLVIITGVIGVPIHELSHAIVALLFGHKIKDMRLFQKPDAGGVMGYVQHSYNQRSIYQQIGNFFIGVAPLFGGSLSVIMLMRVLTPKIYGSFIGILEKDLHVRVLNKNTIEDLFSSYSGLIKVIFSLKNFENPYFYIFLFAAICISSHISLSSADIKGASRGLGAIFLSLLILNTLGMSKYILSLNLIKYNILLTGVLIISVILSAITFLISLIFIKIRL